MSTQSGEKATDRRLAAHVLRKCLQFEHDNLLVQKSLALMLLLAKLEL